MDLRTRHERIAVAEKGILRKAGIETLAHVTGLGQYEMSLNGAKVGKDLLSPGWTDYNDTILYDTHDITAQLREGTNAVGLTLGNGMYHVERRNRFAKFTGSFGPLRAICQLQLEYADGSRNSAGSSTNSLRPDRVDPNQLTGVRPRSTL
jgi:hypothetical protein